MRLSVNDVLRSAFLIGICAFSWPVHGFCFEPSSYELKSVRSFIQENYQISEDDLKNAIVFDAAMPKIREVFRYTETGNCVRLN
jgi:hypothetical protein